MNRAVHDRYRCPEEFLDFRLTGDLFPDAGFFHFGDGITCYGRCSSAAPQVHLASEICDVLQNVTVNRSQVNLPFDPDEIIDNLRLERYPGGQWSKSEKALKEIYYWLRPFTSRSLRGHVQKFRAGNWRKMQFPRWPVDTTVESICENLLLLALQANPAAAIPFVWFWPYRASGCVAMTHDVETIAGRDFCPELLDLDDRFGIKASFQIVPEERYSVPPEFLKQIDDRGFEVAVQDLNHDGRLFDDHEEFLRRAALINRYAREFGASGFRAAVLYRKPEWFSALDFSFDMSMPNVAPLDPQRGGCCSVLPYFIGDLVELPLTTVQDYTLFHLLNDRTIDLWKLQMELIFKRNGLASFIVHPDYIIEPDTRLVYETLLTYFAEVREKLPLWFALPRDIANWWRARSRMSVVQEGDSWRVVGDGADLAVPAFAKLVNGKLIYEFVDTPQGTAARRESTSGAGRAAGSAS